MSEKFSRIICLAAFTVLASACARKPFLYKANAALWPGHDAQAPLFAAKAAIRIPGDLTPYEAAYSTPSARGQVLYVDQAPAGSWPELSPEVVGHALAVEMAQDGFAVSAEVLDDIDNDDTLAAANHDARLYVTVNIDKAEVDSPANNGGTLELSMDVVIGARAAEDYDFSYKILDKNYQAEAPIGPDGDANAATNAALNQLFAQALQDAAQVLQDPALQSRLGWVEAPQS